MSTNGSFEQIVSFDGESDTKKNNQQSKSFSLYTYLKQRELEVTDQREKGGNLWVVGGEEIEPLMKELGKKDIKFNFTQKGSKSTNYKPGWYTSFKE